MPETNTTAACVQPTYIGGQAVLEGVMMRGKTCWAVSARDPQGAIHSEIHPLKSAAAHNAWMRWPLIRGVVAMIESLILGTRALTISAQLAGLEEDEGTRTPEQTDAADARVPADAPEHADTEPRATEQGGGLSNAAIAGSLVIGAVFAVAIFILLPAVVTNLIVGSAERHLVAWNVVDGVLRVLIFLAYVALIARVPDIRRVFAYHGAEHKVINTVEHGEPLTVDAAQKYTTVHVRCGTSFLIMVMVLAILVFSLVPVRAMVADWGITNYFAKLGVVIGSRLILMPVVAGLAYEITVKFAGPRADVPWVRALLAPGLLMQRMTTAEPDDDMIEVAITSTRLVLDADAAAAGGPDATDGETGASGASGGGVRPGDTGVPDAAGVADTGDATAADPGICGEFDLLDDAI
ncbi:MAG: DUF1385 domain-containing protein [Actinomycetes bacterium]|jgi:uncharacterized protein YqhQ|nr:DUF1385 domain-containing protein [Actinomycetes bacterium]